ncbi:MAG TPA: DUF1428 domain-containing protein [Chthoniobacteraceae bacterium]|jgi:uncharacterized protein YbaA (DUF1428 family)|nr:DUF1428 domain-containing protein [Chthoniobacteraceae bacterium]
MPHYVDGFVIPIPKGNVEMYRQIAEVASTVWKDHGAVAYMECVGDDLEMDKAVSFTKLSGATSDETVVFAWIVFNSREHRDEVNEKVMKDPRLTGMDMNSMPFDPARMAYGGFQAIVEA